MKNNIIVHYTKKLFQFKHFEVIKEHVTLPNLAKTDAYTLKHPGAVAIIPYIDSKTLLMIQQYRHSVGKFIWEIPAGTLNLNEVPLACAKRELTEETGYLAKTWTFIGKIYPVPGYSDEIIHIYEATDLHPRKQNLDKDEIIETIPMKRDKVVQMIFSGEIMDSKTICGLFYTLQKPKEALGFGNK